MTAVNIPPEEYLSCHGEVNRHILPRVQSEGEYHLITPNSERAYAIRNEFFTGHVLLLVNSSAERMGERFVRRFQGDKNKFELQVQGRFLQCVQGDLFLGAEITKKMELGLFTKSVCNTILQFCGSKTGSIHYSFGDDKDEELPHITTPFWTSIDRLVVTPAGETPPPLYEPFPEPQKEREARKKSKSLSVAVDLQSTYSFSFKTQFLDLERWAVVGIPLVNKMDLHLFWAEADLRFTAYSLPAGHDGVRHRQKDLCRLFSLEVQHCSNHSEWKHAPHEPYKRIEAAIAASTSISASASIEETVFVESGKDERTTDTLSESDDDSFLSARGRESDLDSEDEDNDDNVHEEDEEEEEDEFFDALDEEQAQQQQGMRTSTLNDTSTNGWRVWPSEAHTLTRTATSTSAKASQQCLVCAVVEIHPSKSFFERKKRVLYAIRRPVRDGEVSECVFRSYGDCRQRFPLVKTYSAQHRHSETERRRLQLNASLRALRWPTNDLNNITYDSFIGQEEREFEDFLGEEEEEEEEMEGEKLQKWRGKDPATLYREMDRFLCDEKQEISVRTLWPSSSHCAALLLSGNWHWTQVYISLENEALVIYRGDRANSKKLLAQIDVRSIVALRNGENDEQRIAFPLTKARSLAVCTFSREYALAFANAEHRDTWMDILNSFVKKTRESEMLSTIDFSSLLSLSDEWELRGKSLLNGRSFARGGIATKGAVMDTRERDIAHIDAHIAEMLELAFSLVEHAQSGATMNYELMQRWIVFLHMSAQLQRFDLSSTSLSSPELCCALLNLYHCMLLHALLVVGTPKSVLKWQSLYRSICYEAFGSVFCLAELEHCIIRAGMDAPDVGFLFKSFLPSKDFSFGLHRKDIRLVWAVNGASRSNIPSVPIYRPHTLEEQLSTVLRLSLKKQVYTQKDVLYLPQFMAWYSSEFPWIGTNNEIMGATHFFTAHLSSDPELCESIRRCTAIKFVSFDLDCQWLQKMT